MAQILGKVYKIVNTVTHECYIGTTINEIHRALNQHRSKINNPVLAEKNRLYQSMLQHGADKFVIELVESFEVRGQYDPQLGIRKQHYVNYFAATLNTA